MALYHKWDVKNDFAYVLKFFSLISDGLGKGTLFYDRSFLTIFPTSIIEKTYTYLEASRCNQFEPPNLK